MPGYVHPDHCELCGVHTGQSYEVHMVLVHPETRPKPERREYTAKELRKMKEAKEKRGQTRGTRTDVYDAPVYDVD